MQRIIESPLGPLLLTAENGCLTGLYFDRERLPEPETTADNEVLEAAARQLAEYFDGKRKAFDVPYHQSGTPFQLEVWKALTEIPYGETATYGEIARRIGKPKACRAVGMANHRNPISIIVPCHRVIGGNGGLTGYGGGLDNKRRLLELEQRWK